MSSNIDILLKLFETLKESSDKNEEATQQLIVQQLDLVGHIKYLPIEDLRQALKEHSKESANNINSCAETVTDISSDLMEEIKKISNKVSKMILVVIVAFTLLAGTYVFVRSSVDSRLQRQIEIFHEKEHPKVSKEVIEEIIKKYIKTINNENETKGK